jgi:hypothetical protein
MAVILFIAAAGFTRAQEPAAPPAPAPEVAQPVPELPQIPAAEPITPVVEPAVAAEPIAPAVEPAAAAPVVAAPAEAKPVVTSTKRVTKKTVVKPAEKPIEAPAVQSTGPAPAAAAAVSTAPAMSIPPAPPAARAAVVESHAEEPVPQKKLGAGSWVLFAVALLAMAGIAVKFLRRPVPTPTSIVDFTTIHPEPKPVLVTLP